MIPSAVADPAKLRACWHPVAWSRDVALDAVAVGYRRAMRDVGLA
jgi:hypothetical protein